MVEERRMRDEWVFRKCPSDTAKHFLMEFGRDVGRE